MELQLRDQSSRLGGSHPRIKALKDQIAFWKEYVLKSEQENELQMANVNAEVALRRYLIAIDQNTEDLKGAIEKESAGVH